MTRLDRLWVEAMAARWGAFVGLMLSPTPWVTYVLTAIHFGAWYLQHKVEKEMAS